MLLAYSVVVNVENQISHFGLLTVKLFNFGEMDLHNFLNKCVSVVT